MGCMFSKKSCVKKYRGQSYAKIRKHYMKLSHNLYFKDLKFPASDSILTIGTDIPRNIEWKRPTELCDNPQFLVGLLGEHTVVPGILSPTWVSSALALLSHRPELWHWVVPQYRLQCWGEDGSPAHPGVFHFRLWYRGTWTDVVIDDLLPVLDGNLVCAQSSCSNEWWPSLLEKAYAKLLGSYGALKSVSLADVLVDLTGGVSELWPVPTKVSTCNGEGCADEDNSFWHLFLKLKTELSHQTLVTAYVRKEAVEEESTDRTSLGLIFDHPYLVVAIKRIHLENSALKGMLKGKEKVVLLRLCNPSVTTSPVPSAPDEQAEKNEASTSDKPDFVFSHKHLTQMLSKVPEWARLTDMDRQKMGLDIDNDREFWMPAEDFVAQFGELCVCRILSTSGAPLACVLGEINWRNKEHMGVWDSNSRGGSGRSSGRSTPTQNLLTNPQFILDIPSTKGANVVVQLIQWSSNTMETQEYPSMGFTIYKIEDNRKYRLHSLNGHSTVLSVGPVPKREVNSQCHFSTGRYVIVAHNDIAPTSSAQLRVPKHSFLLRCFVSECFNLFPAVYDLPPKHWWHCFTHDVENITVVTVKDAEDLKFQSSIFKCNPYCEIKCEGSRVKTSIIENSNVPSWECSFVFYRRALSIPLTVRVYSHRPLIPSKLIGQAHILAPVNHQPTLLRADLSLPGDEDEAPRGVLILEVTSEDDLNAI